MNCSPPPRCGKAAEAPLKNAPLQQLFHNVLVQIEIHLSLLCALNRSNSKTVPNFLGRDKPSTFWPFTVNVLAFTSIFSIFPRNVCSFFAPAALFLFCCA